jgi:hypothetical protein
MIIPPADSSKLEKVAEIVTGYYSENNPIILEEIAH